jgi:hypothetical protein
MPVQAGYGSKQHAWLPIYLLCATRVCIVCDDSREHLRFRCVPCICVVCVHCLWWVHRTGLHATRYCSYLLVFLHCVPEHNLHCVLNTRPGVWLPPAVLSPVCAAAVRDRLRCSLQEYRH